MSWLVMTAWKKYGHDRTYLSTADGTKLGYRDNATGELVLLDEARRSEVELALAVDGPPPASTASGLPTVEPPPVEPPPLEPPPVEPATHPGVAGGSARAEHERRVAKHEARVRERHPRLGGLILALADEPQHARAWKTGAVGEERVGARLDGLAGDGVLALHDRRIPGTRANIDHLAIGPSGIFVIDAKRYVDAKIEVRRNGGFFSPVTERLFVGGRDQTKLIAGLASQVAAVYACLDGQGELEHVPVQPVLAFVDALFPLLGSVVVAGVPVLGLKGTAKLVRREGPVGAEQRAALQALLASRLPAYSR